MAEDNCSSFSGYTPNVCDIIASGLDEVWFSPYDNATVWSANSSNYITTATTANPEWVECEIDDNLSHLDEELISNVDFKSLDLQQSFELVLLGQSQNARNTMNRLMRGRWRLALKTKSGEWVLFGRSKGLRATGGKGTSSAKSGEESSLRLTFTAQGGPAYAATFSDYYVQYNFA